MHNAFALEEEIAKMGKERSFCHLYKREKLPSKSKREEDERVTKNKLVFPPSLLYVSLFCFILFHLKISREKKLCNIFPFHFLSQKRSWVGALCMNFACVKFKKILLGLVVTVYIPCTSSYTHY